MPIFTTLAAPNDLEQEIKKSRFIAWASRADSPEEAMAFLEEVRDPEATHNCWAYRMGPMVYRFSDDGEPGGTAGRPMLGAIEQQGLQNVVVVVTRYYGGIKLGAGGLARAYGGCAASCMREAEHVEIRPQVVLQVVVPFQMTGAVYPTLARLPSRKEAEDYVPEGVALRLRMDATERDEVEVALRDATRGRAVFTVLEADDVG